MSKILLVYIVLLLTLIFNAPLALCEESASSQVDAEDLNKAATKEAVSEGEDMKQDDNGEQQQEQEQDQETGEGEEAGSIIQRLFADFIDIDDQRLINNVIVIDEEFEYSDEDWALLTTLSERSVVVVSHAEYEFLFPESQVSCLFKGTPIDYILNWNEKSPIDIYEDELYEWVINRCQKSEIGWVSYIEGAPLNIYWVDSDGNKVENGKIQAGEENAQWRFTYLGHKFIIEDPENRIPPREYVITHDSINIIGEYKPLKEEQKPRPDEDYLKKKLEMEVKRTEKIKRVFTDVGFKKIEMPRNVWGAIQAYYYNNRASTYVELFGDYIVNWYVTPPTLIILVSLPYFLFC